MTMHVSGLLSTDCPFSGGMPLTSGLLNIGHAADSVAMSLESSDKNARS